MELLKPTITYIQANIKFVEKKASTDKSNMRT
jgi:hypothetical protein